jgi:hypothetical protein
MANTLTFAWGSASSASLVKDLTDAAVNPYAVEPATPRVGGFVMRQRFNGASVNTVNVGGITNSTSSTSAVANRIYVLDIPRRTLLTDLRVYAVAGKTAPNHKNVHVTNQTTAATSSDLLSVDLGFFPQQIKQVDVTSGARSISWDSIGSTIGKAGDLVKPGNSAVQGSIASWVGTLSAYSTATSSAASTMKAITTTATYFPNGGRLVLGVSGGGASKAHSTNAASYSMELTGTWEVQAECKYVPE